MLANACSWGDLVKDSERIYSDFPAGYRFLAGGGNPSDQTTFLQRTAEANNSVPASLPSALLEHVPFGETYSVEATTPPFARFSMAMLHRDRITSHHRGMRLVLDDLQQGCWRPQKRCRCFYNDRAIFVLMCDPYPKQLNTLKSLNLYLQLYEEAEKDPAVALRPGEDITLDYEFDGGNAEYARIGAGGFGCVYRVRRRNSNEPMRVVKVMNKAQYARSEQDVRHLIAELTITRHDYRGDTGIFNHISKQVALYHSPWRIFLVLELVNADKPQLHLSTRLYYLYATVRPQKISNVPALLQKKDAEPRISDDAIVREALADLGLAEEPPITCDVHRMLLHRPNLSVPHRKVLLLAKKMLEAVNAIHQRHVVHRDVKMQNVVVSEHRHVEELDGKQKVMVEEKVEVRLIDFGLAKVLRPGSAGTQPTPGLGEDITMALETWKSTKAGYWTSDVAELPKLDVYGVGIVLFCICRLRYPYSVRDIPGYVDMSQEEQQNALVALIERGVRGEEFWCDSRNVSEDSRPQQRSSSELMSRVLRPLITALMENDLTKRPSAAEALQMLRELGGDFDDDTYRFFVDMHSGQVTELNGEIVSSPPEDWLPTNQQGIGDLTSHRGFSVGMSLSVADLRADDSCEKVGDALRNSM